MESGGDLVSGQGLSVIPEDVKALGRYAYNQAEALRSALNSVGQEVDELTSSGWTGAASTTFAHGWGECRDGGIKIIHTLAVLAEKLGVAEAVYLANESGTSTTISEIGR